MEKAKIFQNDFYLRLIYPYSELAYARIAFSANSDLQATCQFVMVVAHYVYLIKKIFW